MLVNVTIPKLITTHGRNLMPGTNKLTTKKDLNWWAIAREHKSIKKRIDAGIIVEETDFDEMKELADKAEKKGKGKDAAAAVETAVDAEMVAHIKTLNPRNAQQLVKDTTDAELLRAWLKTDDRKPVQQAIKKQLEVLNEPLKERDRSQQRQITTGKGVEEVECEVTPNAIDD